ncbi:a-factor receptor [Steccherinum ochraceum]|uniref:A-factor receptor n=1 Tax=Steccherinum ochraceum TaxID=92696 RepID=A0A4V2MVK8_9APHY|nr:a-factor receptor [Steccherinum ochraceum]
MTDITYPAYPILAIVAAVLVLVPLPWHFQAWNAGTCLFMVWTSVACLNLGINSIVWHSDAINHAPIWCDISSRIIVAVAVAIPTASLCINRRLYKIATMQRLAIGRDERRRAVMVDLSLGMGIPLLQVVMQYIVSGTSRSSMSLQRNSDVILTGHRFDIYEELGCYPFTYNTPVAFPLSYLWPPVIGLVSAGYCFLTLRAFWQRRAQFSEFLASKTSLRPNRYFRLMALATGDLLFTMPIALYGAILNATDSTIFPWISWADTHADYWKVNQVPALLWRSSHVSVVALEMTRWAPVICSLIFFAFFGFAEEARRHYADAIRSVLRRLGLSGLRRPSLFSRHTLPTFVRIEKPPVYSAGPYSAISPASSKVPILSSSPTASSAAATTESFHSVAPPPPVYKDSGAVTHAWLPSTPSTVSDLSPSDHVFRLQDV